MTTLFPCDRCGEEHSVAHLYKVTMTTANEAPLRPIWRATYCSIFVPRVLFPAANLHQHAKDVVGIRAPNRSRVAPKTLSPHLYGGHRRALDRAHAVACSEHISPQKGASFGNIQAVPVLWQQCIEVFRDHAFAHIGF